MAAAQLNRSWGGWLGAAKPRLVVTCGRLRLGRVRAGTVRRSGGHAPGMSLFPIALAGRPALAPFAVPDRCAILSLLSGGWADGCRAA